MNNAITKKIDNDGCEIIEVKFGNGNVGTGLGAITDALKVQLFPMDSEYPIGDEVNYDDAKKAFDECKNIVELTFPTVESIDNFIQILKEYKHKFFYKNLAEESKPRRATNRELAKWLSQGNGEMRYEQKQHVYYSSTCFDYDIDNEDEPRFGIQVRKWDDTDWYEPTADYMGIES